ncbi:MAG: hypothetical protein GY801_23910, partial [bacterium]|nr:hypothetical protein [bacterium]
MAAIVKENFELSDTLVQLYQEMAVSPVTLLTNYALSHIHTKIQKYTVENAHFEKKYGETFQEFKSRVDAMEDEEHFEWEDDLMDWEFAVENLMLWR